MNYYEDIFGINENTVFEDATYDEEHKYPIFIVLMHTGTVLSNAIKQVTRAEFSHAAISFNSSLNPLYSFGGKTRDKGFGFVVQDPKDKFYKSHHAHYNVYVMSVSKEARDLMKQRLKYFTKNKDKLKYDKVGLVQVFFNQETDYKNTKFFCSRFVMDIIAAGNPLDKVASLWKPEDIKQLQNISLIQTGDDFYKYSKTKTEKELNKFKLNNTNIIESLIIKYKDTHPGLYKILNEDYTFTCHTNRDINNLRGLIEFCNKTLKTCGYDKVISSTPINIDIEGKLKL